MKIERNQVIDHDYISWTNIRFLGLNINIYQEQFMFCSLIASTLIDIWLIYVYITLLLINIFLVYKTVYFKLLLTQHKVAVLFLQGTLDNYVHTICYMIVF